MSELDSEELRQRIQQALSEQRWADAATLLDSWTRQFPERADGWYARAQCLVGTALLDEALACARRAWQLSPDEPKYLALLHRIEQEIARRSAAATVEDAGPSDDAPATLIDDGGAERRPPADRQQPEATLVEGASTGPEGVAPTLVDASATAAEAAAADAAVEHAPSERPEPTIVETDRGVEPTMVDADPAVEPTMVDADPAIESTAVDDGGATLVDRPTPTPTPAHPPVPEGRWRAGTVVEGRYEVRGSNRGGMGEVYFVFDRELGLEIAVKTPLPSALASEAGRQRFFREAEAWVALGLHPNICSAYYVREIDAVPRLFIEYVDGGTLEEWLKRHPDAPAADRLDFAIQIAAGMEHSHTVAWHDDDGQEHQGLVHRDLKPANILLGSDGRARVTDFGLVGRDVGGAEQGEGAATDESLDDERTLLEIPTDDTSSTGRIWGTMTVAGKLLGSPVYMAPEQWAGAHFAGTPADIYAFGCILYELVCAGRPFTIDPKYRGADGRAQLAIWQRMHRSQAPKDPRSLVTGLDDELAETMLGCLAKDPQQRPSSFAELGQTLRGVFERVAGRSYPRPAATAAALLADSLNNRGVSFASLGQEHRAERAWRDALTSDPQHTQAGFNLALLEWQSRGAADQEVIHRMAELRRSDSGDWRSELLAGRAMLTLGSFDGALECLQQAAVVSGNAPEAVRDLCLGLCAAAEHSKDPELWQQAAALISDGSAAQHGDPATLICHALALRRVGDQQTSERLWAEAKRQLPEAPKSLERAAARLLPGFRLDRQIDVPLGRISSVALDHNGTTTAFGTETGAVAILNPKNGELRTLRGQGGRIRCTAAVPGIGLVLSAQDNEAIFAWDIATGGSRNLQAHTGFLNALSVSRDGRLAIGASSTGALVVWDLTTGRRSCEISAHTGFATCTALSGDGAVAVSGGADGALAIIDLSGNHTIGTRAAHSEGVTAVAISDDGRFALSGGSDGACTLWELGREAPIATLEGHAGAISFAALTADCTRALTGAADGTLRQWELPSGRTLAAAHTGVPIVAGSASGDWGVVAAAHGSAISQYTMLEAPEYRPAWAVAHLVTSLEAEEREQRFRDLLDRSHHLVEAGELATARIVLGQARAIPGYERAPESLETLAEVDALYPRAGLADAWEEQVLRGHDDAVTALALATLAERVFSCGRDHRLIVWDWSRGRATGEIQLPSIPQAACIIGDEQVVATADLDNKIRIWDLESGSPTRELTGHEARIRDLAGEPRGRWLLSVDIDGAARLWDADTGACRHQLTGHIGQVHACALSPDGRLAATGGDDGILLVWDLESGRSTGGLEGHEAAIGHLAWSTDGRYLLSSGGDGVRLWDLPSGRCLRSIEPAGAPPSCAALSPDGRFAAVGESGGAVSLWRLRDRRRLRLFEGHTGSVSALAFTRDGRRLITSGDDGTVRVWYLEWEPELCAIVEWDRAALPHLDMFLVQHTPEDGGLPRWTDEDIRRLLSDLQHRGLGWIRPDGVRTKLEEMARGRVERPSIQAPSVGRQLRTPTPRARERRRELLFRSLGAAAVGIVLLLVGSQLWSYRQLHLDYREAKELRSHNLAVLLAPTVTSRRAPCDRERLPQYLDDYTTPTDSLKDWSAANHCLVVLADPRSVAPLLEMVREKQQRPPPITGIQIGADRRQVMDQVRRAMSGGLETERAVQSLLARMGRPVVISLTGFLDDPVPEVRDAAAGALALAGTEDSIAALVSRANDPNVIIRRAVSKQVQNLAISDRLDIEQAFEIAMEMATDEDQEIRLAIAERLGIFSGARPRALARQLLADSNPEVATAALVHTR